MGKGLPEHVQGLLRYLSQGKEKANEDLALNYFRKNFDKFSRQSDASRSDGYVPGHFVLELKGKTNDWLDGLFQGLVCRKRMRGNYFSSQQPCCWSARGFCLKSHVTIKSRFLLGKPPCPHIQ